jgi:hypothetical protein
MSLIKAVPLYCTLLAPLSFADSSLSTVMRTLLAPDASTLQLAVLKSNAFTSLATLASMLNSFAEQLKSMTDEQLKRI